MGVGAGLYMYDVVVKTLTFAISSTDEFLLLRPKERLRSRPIVMSLSVCLSVCLSLFCPRAYAHRRDLYQFFAHVAYVRGSVLLRHVDHRPHRLSEGTG